MALLIAVPLFGATTRSQTRIDPRLAQLGPEEAYILPKDLADLVNTAHAAVVAVFGPLGQVRLVDDTSKSGKLLAWDGLASYQVVIREVLFDKLTGSAPELSPNMHLELTQRVGRKGAEDFLDRKVPVSEGDECLLFLWYRPGAAEWSILQWPLQFRRSTRLAAAVEPVTLLPSGLSILKQEWIGPRVSIVSTDRGIAPSWISLRQEVQRLATARNRH
jgi:hypothetical protein